MNVNADLYNNYTRTQALPVGVDEEKVLAWSTRYFKANYGEFIPSKLDAEILEVGCGYGRYLKALEGMGYSRIKGIDVSPDQVAYAQRVLKLGEVEQADAVGWLDGRHQSFDIIMALDVMEHMEVEYLFRFGKAAADALKPGGCLIIQVPNGLSPMNPYIYGDLTHVRAFTPRSVRQLFSTSGLELLHVREIAPLPAGFVGRARRLLWSLVVKPLLSLFMRAVHGMEMDKDIYTTNLMAVARKPEVS